MGSVKNYLIFIFKLTNAGLGFCFGIFVNKVSGSFPDWLLIFLFTVLIPIFIYDLVKAIKSIDPNIKTWSLKDDTSQKEGARKGLILFLSIYKNFRDKEFTEGEMRVLISNRDYKALDIMDTSATNFGHAINAINAHKSKLEFLWIVTTKAPLQSNAITSLDYLPVFAEYIKKEIDPSNKIKVLLGKDYAVDLTEKSKITENTYERIKNIYNEAQKKYRLFPNELVVDVTGGFTYMTVGAVLASLAKDQDVQVIVSDYNKKKGDPLGGEKSYPIRIGFAPHFTKD